MTEADAGTGAGFAGPPSVGPQRRRPSPQELAAIVAAVEAAWPRPQAAPPVVRPRPNPASWRWSGRWWASRDVAARRVRPGR